MPDFPSFDRRLFLASAAAMMPAVGMAQTGDRVVYRDPHAPIGERVRDLLGRMTLEEKAAQMRCMWLTKYQILDGGQFSPAKAQTVLAQGIGQIGSPGDTIGTPRSSKDYYRSPEETVDLVNAIQRHLTLHTRLGIPALCHEETAHGLKARDTTIFPIPPGLGSTWDLDLVEQAFAVAGREARLRGATVALSPVVDLARDPRYGRVEEFFGEDPWHVAHMGIAAVRGQQGHSRPLGKDKVFVTLKHFVHGAPQGGLNTAPADMSERTLREAFLVPFERIIRETDPAVIMPSYNELEGVPSHANVELLQHTGRERLGFKGAYFSDYGGVTNLVSDHRMAANNDDGAVLAITAGVDAEMPDGQAYARIPELVRSGRLSEAQIDRSVARILALKFEAGLFENPYIDKALAVHRVNTPTDIRLARTVAQKSIVLLKNDGVLPLDRHAPLKLAVIGPNAAEALLGGYSGVNARSIGILDGIRAAAGAGMTIGYAEGVRIVEPDPSGQHSNVRPLHFVDPAANVARIAEAVALAARSDMILLVVGDAPEITRESVARFAAGDRSTLGLFGDQDALVEAMIATGKPIVAVLINGRPLAVTRLAEKANALIEGWYLGQEGGHALADVVFGAINPGGKLAVTIPHGVGELPDFYDQHPSARLRAYVEGGPKPLFAFGHGLSYTSFAVSAPRLVNPQIAVGDTAVLDVDVANTGARAGDEVVQIYIRDDVSSVPRPVLELRAFQRVTLRQGETRTLRFALPPDALAFWNIAMNFVVEPGTFTIFAGPASDMLKSTRLTVI
ncbi:glycoside hydrolase family 3 N-terminal domain-containing protein [Novosphingobium sp.]|uniref:glycoside hydrolase family 3 N-terminal domain-containing protein n=1 Tax=Novosphingobium sp. TaxID=1874826 RepID=UPI003D0A877A